MQFDKPGGFRWLDSWVMGSIVQLGTFRFCERFLTRDLDPTGRQYDQMTQAARSGVMNNVEGNERTSTSKETEMRLTNVAHASLSELKGDFEKWLLRLRLVPWPIDSEDSQRIYSLRLDRPDYGKDVVRDSCLHVLTQKAKFDRWLEADDHEMVANCLLILLSRTINMLGHQLQSQGRKFAGRGGFRERLTEIRVEARAAQDGAPTCPDCGAPMRRRQAGSGRNAGAEFWGCTGYPKCHGVRQIE
ncbi:MAG: Topoisomerase DNA binding C4 zinc finger [Lentisphaerae bacterium ADurb.BinA184]|nr:MAG: Topoisomerase DNA binding C4 zinc finger [Lentisphaerae bacterium ADurb.BinA184]